MRKKRNTYFTLLIILLLIGIGFAALTTTLKIDGILGISKVDWDVHFENIEVNTNSVNDSTAPVSDDATTTELSYSANFTKPGDFYEFTVDMVNDGSLDLMIDTFSNKVYEVDGETEKVFPAYLSSTVSYSDGAPFRKSQILRSKATVKVKVRVEYRTDVDSSELPSENEASRFIFKVTYKQANSDAIEISQEADFEHDSWDDIIAAYKRGKITQLTEAMNYGTTKEVKLDLDHDGTLETTKHVRIANLTPCSEVSTTSKSACGLVIEFSEVATQHRMNHYNSSVVALGNGTMGGWEYSDMRAYLNDKIYTHEEIDYSNNGFYSALPSNLRGKIIDTIVVSGHGSSDITNFTTTDKLYLLSRREVWNYVGAEDTASGDEYTRQLDYYEKKGVTTSNFASAIKELKGSYANWWLRSAGSSNSLYFSIVGSNGNFSYYNSYDSYGVSPAFRLAN